MSSQTEPDRKGMMFKPREEPVYTEDFLYDLFYHGCVAPDVLLEEGLARQRVELAIETIEEYISKAQQEEVVELL